MSGSVRAVTGGVQTIERAAAIMRLLAESDQQLALTQIAAALGLAKPTAHGLLKTLWQVGFVVKDPISARYGPVPDFAEISRTPVDPNRLRGSALNFADSLASRTGESVRVGVLEGYLVRIVHHVFAPGRASDRLDVDAVYLAHACALGKVLLAYRASPASRVAEEEPRPESLRPIVGTQALEQELRTVRSLGWASHSDEGKRAEASIAAPIRTGGGLVIGSIGITGSSDRVLGRDRQRTERLARDVRQVAASISAGLGAGQ